MLPPDACGLRELGQGPGSVCPAGWSDLLLGYWSRSGVGILFPDLVRKMPAKPSLTATITLTARDGITPETVGKLKDWVGKQKNVNCAVACAEPNSRGVGVHLHVAIGFKEPVKVADDYKDRLRTCLSEELSDPENWGRASIVCKSHHDLAGLIGGYYEKDSRREIRWIIGTPPTPDELAQGAKRREDCLEAIKKKTLSKSAIPTLFKKTHWEIIAYEDVDQVNYGLPDDEEPYTPMTPANQVDYIYRKLIADGYEKILMELSEAKLAQFVKYWKELTYTKV